MRFIVRTGRPSTGSRAGNKLPRFPASGRRDWACHSAVRPAMWLRLATRSPAVANSYRRAATTERAGENRCRKASCTADARSEATRS